MTPPRYTLVLQTEQTPDTEEAWGGYRDLSLSLYDRDLKLLQHLTINEPNPSETTALLTLQGTTDEDPGILEDLVLTPNGICNPSNWFLVELEEVERETICS